MGEPDPSSLSTSELKRALAARLTPASGPHPLAGRLAQCIERPDFEELYREVMALAAAAPPKPAAAPQQQQAKIEEPPQPAAAAAAGTGPFGLSWTQVIMIVWGLYMFLGKGSGGDGGASSEPHAPADTAYISGDVAEITNLPALKKAYS